ncbi:hypothetical protein QQ045_002774 [Rhodiola kirilowii]
MPDNKKAWVEQVLGTTLAKLPVRYLGNATGKGGFLVSWKEVCGVKSEGGLGIKDLSTMNEATRLKQLWEMRNEVDNVWKAWTRAYWTKGRDWWEVENASKTTWIIKDLEFSKEVSEASTKFLKVRGMPAIWHLLIPWFNGLKENALRTRMMAAAISMAAYEIWRSRNSNFFKVEAPSVPKALRRILWVLLSLLAG